MILKKYKLVFRTLILLLVSILVLTSCEDNVPDNNQPDNNEDPGITNSIETYKILEDTDNETSVFIFRSNVAGPKVAIVGGIHGDEVAGWKTAQYLVERENFYKGEVLIIPNAYMEADSTRTRYPGFAWSLDGSSIFGNKYNKKLDLNRNFPGSANGSETEQIAFAISQEVEKFEPQYIIDLHESRRSYSESASTSSADPLLGDLLIYGNRKSALFTDDLTYEYNQTCKLKGEVSFGTDTNAPDGAFNQYFGDTYPDAIVFTIETNRQLSETRRIEQQTQLLDLFFKTIWS